MILNFYIHELKCYSDSFDDNKCVIGTAMINLEFDGVFIELTYSKACRKPSIQIFEF